MVRYTQHTLPSGYIDICFHGESTDTRTLLSIHPEAGAPNERLANWLIECLSAGLGSCALELAAPKLLEALCAASSVIDTLEHQVQQMQGMFDDEDGAIADALKEAEEVEPIIRRAIASAKGDK